MNTSKTIHSVVVSILLTTALPLVAQVKNSVDNPVKVDLGKGQTVVLKSDSGKAKIQKKFLVESDDTKSLTVVNKSNIQKATEKGGIDGGGGDLDFDDQVYASKEEILDTVKIARVPVEAIFRNIELHLVLGKNLPPDRDSGYDELSNMYSRFFQTHKNIYETLSKVVFDVKNSGPCQDPHTGKDMDASVTHGNSDRICISADSLSKKLIEKPEDPDGYKARIIALIFHELAHMFGATESESIEIQKNIYSAFFNNNILKLFSAGAWRFQISYPYGVRDDGTERLVPWITAIQNKDINYFSAPSNYNFTIQADNAIKVVEWQIPELRKLHMTQLPYADRTLLTVAEFQTIEQMFLRLKVIGRFLENFHQCSSWTFVEYNCQTDDKKWFYDSYDKVGSNPVSMDDYYVTNFSNYMAGSGIEHAGAWRHPDIKVTMKRYQNREDTLSDLQETVDTLKDLGTKVKARVQARFLVNVLP